jgi:hypothetical protein
MQAPTNLRSRNLCRASKRISAKRAKKTETAPIVRCRTIVFSVVQRLASEQYVYSESSIAEIHSARENAVREDIARRLKGVCSNFSDDEFDKLVKLMAARQVRCERRQNW